MVRFLLRVSLAILVLFLLPALAAAGWWSLQDRPAGWRSADWTSSGMLDKPSADQDAVIHVMAARTGGMKGALSLHSWLVLKKKGASTYDRYDVVGWGTPVRKNAYPADARWYSNPPTILRTISGGEAERLIPQIEKAVAAYPYAQPGNYVIWPGPNSNSFVAHVLRAVPEIGITLPPHAVGRDFPTEGRLFAIDPDWKDFRANLFGYVGIAAGARSGFEIQFLGLVTGFDILHPGIKLPGIGRIGI